MLYLHVSSIKASPKAISGRTSYLQVRLEFLRYPQVIPALFSGRVVRSSMGFYSHFNLLMGRSPGFGSTACNYRPVQTRFPFGSKPSVLNLAAYSNSPVRSTKSTRSHMNRALSACKHRVSGSLSLPFRGSFHLSLTVLSAIGHQQYLALEGGPSCFPPDSSCPVVLWISARFISFSLTGLLPALARLSSRLQLTTILLYAGPQPLPTEVDRFGLFPFRSPLLRESMFLSSPPGT